MCEMSVSNLRCAPQGSQGGDSTRGQFELVPVGPESPLALNSCLSSNRAWKLDVIATVHPWRRAWSYPTSRGNTDGAVLQTACLYSDTSSSQIHSRLVGSRSACGGL